MQGSMPPSGGVPSTCTAVEASGTTLPPARTGDSYGMLKSFVEASHARGILSGVQVKLMLELAEEFATTSSQGTPAVACDAITSTAVIQQSGQHPFSASAKPAKVEAQASLPEPASREATPAAALQLPANDSSNSTLTAAAVMQACTGAEAGSSSLPQPQLHIQPLNLNSQLTAPPLPSVSAAFSNNTAAQLQQALASSSSALTQQAGSLLGFSPALLAAVAAQAAAASAQQQQQQQQPHQLAALNPSYSDSFPAPAQQYAAADALTAAAGAGSPAAAAWGGSAAAAKTSAARKHRFTKEQHAAILESVERNYALYPSRYTELVIKEMQCRFPGIEINNACVRKIKFRASEATKQVPTACPAAAAAAAAGPTMMGGMFEPVGRRESQAAAEAAHGLVGLATAAAAASELRCAYSAPVSSTESSQADSKDGGNCDAVMTDDCTTSRDAAAAAAQQVQQQQHPGAAVVDALRPQQQLQQQAGPSSAYAHQGVDTADDGCIDSAAVAAAEAMHMLASCGSLSDHTTAAAAAGGCLKRRLEEPPAAAAAGINTSIAAEGSVAPSVNQIAEALAAAAGLACTSSAAPIPQQPQQLATASQELQWPSAAAMLQAAAAAQQPNLQQQLQQFQQQQQQQQAALARYNSATAAALPDAQVAAAAAAAGAPAAKRQRLNGVQMSELVASVRHHVQVNPERYTHCVIKDMKDKYPDLELNMGQIRKIKFRTLGNVNPRQAAKPMQQQVSPCDPAAAAAAVPPADAAATYRLPTSLAAAAAPPMNFTFDAAKALEAVAAAAAAAAAASAGMGSAPVAAGSAFAGHAQML